MSSVSGCTSGDTTQNFNWELTHPKAKATALFPFSIRLIQPNAREIKWTASHMSSLLSFRAIAYDGRNTVPVTLVSEVTQSGFPHYLTLMNKVSRNRASSHDDGFQACLLDPEPHCGRERGDYIPIFLDGLGQRTVRANYLGFSIYSRN
jgi:hypothetical protein